MSNKEKIKIFLKVNGVDILLGLIIVVVLLVGAITSKRLTADNLLLLVPVVIGVAFFYVSRVLMRKRSAVEGQKEMHDKLIYNVERDLSTGHYDAELRYTQLMIFRQNMIITDDEYRELKARYDRDQKERAGK